MKKSLLALAVAAMAASSVASAATVYEKDGDSLGIYGRVQGVMYNGNTATLNHYDDISLQASGRLGFDMRTQLTQGVAGFAKMEWDVADGTRGTDGGEWGVRYAWIGADFGQYGQIKGGRFEDATKYVLSSTDIFDDWGCYGQFANDPKRDGIVMYSWSGYGFDVNASFQTAQDDQYLRNVGTPNFAAKNFTNHNVDVDHAYALSAGYKSAPVLFGPIAVKAGFAHTQTQVDDVNQGAAGTQRTVDTIQDIAVSASWGDLAQGPYVGLLYNIRGVEYTKSKDLTMQGFESVLAYGFGNGVSVRTGYLYKKAEFQGYEAEAAVMPVYVNYQLNPRVNVWAEARFDVGTEDTTQDKTLAWPAFAGGESLNEDVFSVGARYTF